MGGKPWKTHEIIPFRPKAICSQLCWDVRFASPQSVRWFSRMQPLEVTMDHYNPLNPWNL
jgi:hypothetical protein